MELRDFAERILTGGSLADKLEGAELFTDATPGRPTWVDAPARPPELRFAEDGGRLPTSLEHPRDRGLLLHRFANHELLALEIMASTLLRFPDAPAAFRFGLARTMVEEQRHLRLYLERMGATGVALGECPVNAFFWRWTQDIGSPWDYVLRMPLTFEQANLDFTRTWRARFAELGDAETVAALDVVYADEIGHVRGGLALFRQWKDPAVDEWDAWERGLAMPLSPMRARGPVVDREGRRAAGFTDAWIDRLELYARSKGRPPRVYAMNPGCEDEVARPGHTPRASLAALAHDLAPLFTLVAGAEDVVITPRPPGAAWRRQLVDAGLALPEYVVSAAELAGRKTSGCVPWGQSPDAARLFAPLESPAWAPATRDAYSKVVAMQWRKELEPASEGHVCVSLAEAEAAAARGWILKAPWSTAGRDRKRGPLDDAGRAWAARVLAEQGALRAEPWRERVLDLSFHLDLGDTDRFVGTCRFDTTPNGQFSGTRPGRWLLGEPPEIRRALSGRLRPTGEALAALLGPRLRALGVRGPVGVDAFLWRDGDTLRLDPLVEVNPRWTMGRLSLALDRRVHPHATARWRFVPRARFEPGPPLHLEDGLWRSGTLCTNDPATATQVVTVLELT